MSAALAASLAEPARSEPVASALGEWREGGLGLPCYAYTGPLRFADHHHQANSWGLDGDMLPVDPVFLLGNHRYCTAPARFSSTTLDTTAVSTVVGRCEQNPIPT